MKLLLVIALLVLLGCVSNKPVAGQAANTDDSLKCEELAKLHPELQESAKEWLYNKKSNENPGDAYCIETISCNGIGYCIKAYVPENDTIDFFKVSIYKESHGP